MAKTNAVTTFQIGVDLELLTCGECLVSFAAPTTFVAQRRRDHQSWYCPNGHPRYFPEKTEEEKLRDQIRRERATIDMLRSTTHRLEDDKTKLKHQVRAQKGVATRLRNKAIAGICAFCSCEFPNVAEHVKAEHPGESLEEAPE